jgi:hypothetical protein
VAGAQAGFTVEQMVQLLQSGASVETLLNLIELRLFPRVAALQSARWCTIPNVQVLDSKPFAPSALFHWGEPGT